MHWTLPLLQIFVGDTDRSFVAYPQMNWSNLMEDSSSKRNWPFGEYWILLSWLEICMGFRVEKQNRKRCTRSSWNPKSLKVCTTSFTGWNWMGLNLYEMKGLDSCELPWLLAEIIYNRQAVIDSWCRSEFGSSIDHWSDPFLDKRGFAWLIQEIGKWTRNAYIERKGTGQSGSMTNTWRITELPGRWH